ncbi:imidazole glycerol phosphate synthase [candidate division MSBL1 archaeon SCGC-AAA261C02]|uniref:Imidazole glycerol phosphate synthase subunit HisF n=1 Tax=candidate division MSBL1 archaeon SCGC-AAA261C02 TaxID=1698272 RepID=A0A133UYZ4_9EURY|nr:imidazole glycerol phosphate synthase [candidate division MSBL1 archaeon SCGC-AAA261C02]
MLTKRIIPCLDVLDGRVVKGVKFKGLRDAGDPAELASWYYEQGADEIVFLDVGASPEERETMYDVVKRTAEQLFIPLTVGGGVRSIENVGEMLKSGADKVGINTAAVENPKLITRSSERSGRQCIVIAIDAKSVRNGEWEVYTYGGREPTGLDAVKWAERAESLGAGEILLTSMDADGTTKGYDLELTRKIVRTVNIPVIASGGAGNPQHMYEALTDGEADAALAASIFHYGEYTVEEVKQYLRDHEVPVRL